ncbi:MAG: TIGR03084 family metal-binding protein [Mycobacterium sp.]
MGLDYPGLLADLRHESDEIIGCLSPLTAQQWRLPTPASGWSIHDQVSHLAFFDDTARLALTDPDRFRREADNLMAAGMDFPDRIAAQCRSKAPEEILEWFINARNQLLAVYDGDDSRRRLPWFGPDMSVASSATARLMETWAHGQDVYDTLRLPHPPSPGLRSIAHLGVATFAFAHTLHGIDIPDEPVEVTLHSPQGEVWTWGPEHSANRIIGPAEDFVLTVTQRRHWTQTALAVHGPVAKRWLDIAQVFAGAPTRRGAPR